jgi:hypothetical protein
VARTVRERPGRIGKTLLISGTPTQIIGVMPGRFRFPNAATKLWLPMRLDPHSPFLGGFNYDAVARLKPGMSIEAAQRDFTNVLPRVVDVAPNMAPGLTMRTVLDQAKPIPRIIPMRGDPLSGLRDGGRGGTAGGHRHGSIRSRRCDRIDRQGDIFGAA